jgi:hypothetical protein
VTVTICERCGRRSGDSAIHDDLYHPVARPRAAEPMAMVRDDNPVEPDEVADAETGIS